jgi:hypothetical protein
VTTNESYYLALVIGSFAAFAAAMTVATVQYKVWLRQQERAEAKQLARPAPAKSALARAA